eukprot:scaffold1881_cov169-Amphora_coffeaeformis.AAC.1
MAHRMIRRQGTFVGIQNGKGHMKTLRDNITSGIIFIGRYFCRVIQNLCQPRDFALHRVLSHPSLQIISRPFDFYIHDTFQYSIDTLNNHGELVTKEREEEEEEKEEESNVRENAGDVDNKDTQAGNQTSGKENTPCRRTTPDRSRGASSCVYVSDCCNRSQVAADATVIFFNNNKRTVPTRNSLMMMCDILIGTSLFATNTGKDE